MWIWIFWIYSVGSAIETSNRNSSEHFIWRICFLSIIITYFFQFESLNCWQQLIMRYNNFFNSCCQNCVQSAILKLTDSINTKVKMMWLTLLNNNWLSIYSKVYTKTEFEPTIHVKLGDFPHPILNPRCTTVAKKRLVNLAT